MSSQSYRVTVDLLDFAANSEIRRFDLGMFRLPESTIFIEAKDPDDAANTVKNELIKKILDQDTSVWTRILCRKIRRRMRIIKIQAVQ